MTPPVRAARIALAAALLIWVPSPSAASPLACYPPEAVQGGLGPGLTTGSIHLCLNLPADGLVNASNSTWRLGVHLNAPLPSGNGVFGVSATLQSLTGCTAGSPTTVQANQQSVFYASSWPITMTDSQCSGIIRVTIIVSTATVYANEISFSVRAYNPAQVVSGELDWLNQAVAFLGAVAWFVWLLALVLTRFIRKPLLRVVADVATWTILALPMDADLWNFFAIGNGAVFLYDIVQAMKGK